MPICSPRSYSHLWKQFACCSKELLHVTVFFLCVALVLNCLSELFLLPSLLASSPLWGVRRQQDAILVVCSALSLGEDICCSPTHGCVTNSGCRLSEMSPGNGVTSGPSRAGSALRLATRPSPLEGGRRSKFPSTSSGASTVRDNRNPCAVLNISPKIVKWRSPCKTQPCRALNPNEHPGTHQSQIQMILCRKWLFLLRK